MHLVIVTTSVRENQKQQTSPVSVLVPNRHQRGATSNSHIYMYIIIESWLWIAAMHGRCSSSNDDEEGRGWDRGSPWTHKFSYPQYKRQRPPIVSFKAKGVLEGGD